MAAPFANPVGAQFTPATVDTAPVPQPPAIPKTLAGEALRAWLEALDHGDSTRIAAYMRTYPSARSIEDMLGFRESTGGFDLLTIERSEARHIAFTLRRRRHPTTVYGELDVTGTPPRLLADGPALIGLDPGVGVASLGIDAATRQRVVNRTAALLDSLYVFPDVARRTADSLRARFSRGAYDGLTNGMTLARRLDDELHVLTRDLHIGVLFSASPFPPAPPTGRVAAAPSAEARERARLEAEERNCGFQRMEQLEDNVGYLKLDAFMDPALCAETAAAALTVLAGTRALVIDLRESTGGTPGMVELVASYLFDRRTHLNDLWTRHSGHTAEFWTRDSVAGRRYGGTKPVYVLTSARTVSGSEEFAYDLQALRRATVVGEPTAGGAHTVRLRRIDDHFAIGVPDTRAINPITGTNWEGTGVQPDVVVPAGDALAKVLELLRP